MDLASAHFVYCQLQAAGVRYERVTIVHGMIEHRDILVEVHEGRRFDDIDAAAAALNANRHPSFGDVMTTELTPERRGWSPPGGFAHRRGR